MGLLDTFCSAISDWFDDKAVDPGKYPAKYHPTIIAQTTIGWRDAFLGHVTTEWSQLLRLPPDATPFVTATKQQAGTPPLQRLPT